MTFTEAVNTGLSNNTTDVTVVGSPSASTRRVVKSITVYNNDTATATVTLKYFDGTNERILIKLVMDVGDTLLYDQIIILDGTSDLVELVLGGAVSTNQLHFTSHYADIVT